MKKYSVAELKRDAKRGALRALLTVRCGETVDPENLPPHLRGSRKICGANSTSLIFENPSDPNKPSWLQLPKAGLVEYTDQHLRIYWPGYREPNAAEKAVLEEWSQIEKSSAYRQQVEIDCLTDGSTSYYQKRAFFLRHDMEYLMGAAKRGLDIDFNRRNAGDPAYIRDESIRGALCMEYQIERVKTLDERIAAASDAANVRSAGETKQKAQTPDR